jgi:peptide/nickel transport system substrate-binding protein
MKKLAAMAALVLIPLSVFAAPSTLVYGTTEKITDIDNASTWDFHTWEYFQNISAGLLTYKLGSSELEPALAEKYSVNKAGDEFTFTLRKGLKFSNGDVLDAAAVKWTIDRVIALKGDPVSLVTDYVDQVIVKDPLTVVFKLKGPTGYFPALIATPPYFPQDPKVFPVDKIIHDPTELPGGQFVGAGPYKLTSYKRDQEAVFSVNENYFGPKGKIDRIIIRYYADATTLRLALDKGEVDLAFKTLNPADIAAEMKNDKVKTFKLNGAFIRWVAFETSEGVFKDKSLRQVFAYLINRPELIQKVYLGQNKPLYSMIPEGMQFRYPTFKAMGDGNVKAAEALLTKAGYTKDKPFAFELWYTTSHYGDAEVNQAEVLKSQLEKTPLVKVTLKTAEWATYKQQWNKKQMPVFLMGWYPDYIDPDDFSAVFTSTEASKGNGIFFSSKAWDDLFEAERTSADPKARDAAFKKVQGLWTDDVPTIPLWQGDLYIFTKKNVTNVVTNASMLLLYDQLALSK